MHRRRRYNENKSDRSLPKIPLLVTELPGAQAMALVDRVRYGILMRVDEVQSGMGRTRISQCPSQKLICYDQKKHER